MKAVVDIGVLILSLALVGCAAKESSRRFPGRSDFDFKFLSEITDHLMNDLRIAETCGGKKIRPELTQFCKALFADQTQEQEQLADMMQRWYGKRPHKDPYPLWIESQDGEIFEKFFLEGVLRGHEDVARLAGECTKKAKHPELASLCQEMSLHRSEEAKIIKTWNCEWFKRCS